MPSIASKFTRGFLVPNIAVDSLLESQLLGLAFATGILDATVFQRYNVFVANMTGNTIFLSIGIINIGHQINLRNVGVCLGCFLGSGLVFGQLGLHVGPRRRIWLLATCAMQTILAAAAAALEYTTPTHHISLPRVLGILALLSAGSGAQVALARTVSIAEITTAVVTSAYMDILVDPNILCRSNAPRARRVLFIIVFLAGALIGSAVYRYIGAGLSLTLVAICKFAVVSSFMMNPPESEPQG